MSSESKISTHLKNIYGGGGIGVEGDKVTHQTTYDPKKDLQKKQQEYKINIISSKILE